MKNKNVRASTITVIKTNKKRCTWTSDENHCTLKHQKLGCFGAQ